MSASINDKIIQSENGGAPEPTTVSSARSISGSSLSCVALTNWPTDTAVHLITYKKKTDGSMDRDTLCLWKGIVSGTTIGTLTLKGGTDAGNAVGDFVEMAPTSALWQDLYDGLTQTLNADGTLKTGIVTSTKIADGSVGTNALADGAVTPGKLQSGAGTSWVWQTYTPTTFVGWSGTPTYTVRYVREGMKITLFFNVSGTSNASTASMSLPVPAKNNNGFSAETWMGLIQDSGVINQTSGRAAIDPTSDNTKVAFFGGVSGGWTASGTKSVRGTIIYEAA